VVNLNLNYCYLDKSRFQISPDNNDKIFENEFIFCMFTSITGCKISLTIEFPNEDYGRHRKKETEEDPKTDKEKYEAKLANFTVQKVIRLRQDKIEDNIRKI
jgi:hypothetical protein